MKFKAAVVQAASCLFDLDASIEKACRLAADAAAQGAKLVLFPEAFIPAYPRGLTFGTVVGSRTEVGRRTWERYRANSVDVPSSATNALGSAAREAKAYLAVGVIERDTQFSRGTLYCALLYFGSGGSAIVSPSGEYLVGPLFDQEGILVAELDLAEVARGKFDFDVAGHYARPDVFQLIINEQPAYPVRTAAPK